MGWMDRIVAWFFDWYMVALGAGLLIWCIATSPNWYAGVLGWIIGGLGWYAYHKKLYEAEINDRWER